MDDKAIVARAIADPAVIRANSTPGDSGVLIPPSPNELRQQAERVVASVIATTLLDQSVARWAGQRVYQLTLTTATEYELPHYVGRVMFAYLDDDGQPLTLFRQFSDFQDWKYRNFRDGTTSDNNTRILYYISRTKDWKLRVGLFPGVSSGAIVDILYRQRYGDPFKMDMLPDEAHPYAELEVIRRMSGGKGEKVTMEARADMRRALTAATGRIKQEYPRNIEWAISRMNAGRPGESGYYTRYFSS